MPKTTMYVTPESNKRQRTGTSVTVSSAGLSTPIGVTVADKKRMLVQYIKKAIDARMEKKIMHYTVGIFPLSIQASTTNVSANVRILTPSSSVTGGSISQGTGVAQRIGNRVRVTKAILRYVVTPRPYDAVTNVAPVPQDLIFYFVRSKAAPCTSIPYQELAGSSGQFLESGAVDTGFSGQIGDVTYDVNLDSYTLLKKKKFKLGFANYGGTGTQANSQSFSNNDYKLNLIGSIDVTKTFPKVIKWDDAGEVTTPWTQLVIQTVDNNGLIAPVTASRVQVSYTIDMYYTDD